MRSSNFEIILGNMKQHTVYRQECLNLIASENVMSPMAKEALASELAGRYAVGKPYARWFPGFQYYDQIEQVAQQIAQKLFRAKFVDMQAPTGMIANMAAYATILKPHDVVLSLPTKYGGHYSHVAKNVLALFQARVEDLPFKKKDYAIDIEKAKQLIQKKQPRMIILGTSEFLFPAPVKELRTVCNKTNTKILYDASHVSGLIAGQTFQNPMGEGADMMTMSTNKTLAAPSHGILAYNDSYFEEKVAYEMLPHQLVSNNHPHHVAALAITLAEFEIFGQEYARQIINNAKVLARTLYSEGVQVLCPEKDFTQSHTILVDTLSDAKRIVHSLAEANIMTNSLQLPWDSDTFESGVRIGTNELTRLGMKEEEMKMIAKLIAHVLLKRKSLGNVRKYVIEMRKCFQKVRYCFE